MRRKTTSALSFRERVLRIVATIPAGSVMTYAEVARRADSLRAARAVGNILHKNKNKMIPCHRVIRSDGTLGGYNQGIGKKLKRLRDEGYLLTV